MSEQLALELVGFAGCCRDSQREAAKHESRRQLVGAGSARLTEPPTAVEQLADRQSAQLLAEPVRCGDDDRPELSERLAAHVDGTSTSEQEQPQRFPPLPRARQRQRPAGQRGPRRAHGVEYVILAA